MRFSADSAREGPNRTSILRFAGNAGNGNRCAGAFRRRRSGAAPRTRSRSAAPAGRPGGCGRGRSDRWAEARRVFSSAFGYVRPIRYASPSARIRAVVKFDKARKKRHRSGSASGISCRCRYCRTSSITAIPYATDTFSDCLNPYCGISSAMSAPATTSSSTP